MSQEPLQEPLFEGFGRPSAPKTARGPEIDEVHVRHPWVLLTNHGHAPKAHLLDDTRAKTRDNSRFARCGAAGAIITVDGAPLAPVCAVCRGIHRRITGETSRTRPL